MLLEVTLDGRRRIARYVTNGNWDILDQSGNYITTIYRDTGFSEEERPVRIDHI